jgi:endogenous inhibitor of DNA gyrase (YacG/DUF329 family)
MFGHRSNRKIFVVRCLRCQRDVPTGAQEFPFQSVAVACPLCGDQSRYRPSDVFLGLPHVLVQAQVKVGAGV